MINRGQVETSMVWGVVMMLVAVAVGGLIFSTIHEETEDTVAKLIQTTNNREFTTADFWTLENTAPGRIAHNSSDEWIDINTSGSGTGDATVKQSIDIDTGTDTIEDAIVEAAYQVDNADNINSLTMYLRVIDPAGNVDHETKLLDAVSTTSTWSTDEKDIDSVIDEDGEWTVKVYTNIDASGTTVEANVDNVQLDVDAESTGEMTSDETGEGASTVFPLLVLMVIVSVFVALIGVLRQM